VAEKPHDAVVKFYTFVAPFRSLLQTDANVTLKYLVDKSRHIGYDTPCAYLLTYLLTYFHNGDLADLLSE